MKVLTLLTTLAASTAIAAPLSRAPYSNDTTYMPLQFLNGVLPLPKTDNLDLGNISKSLIDDITNSAALVSLVDCAKIGAVDAGKEIFHVLTGSISGYFMKDNSNKQLWAVFGDNPTAGSSTDLVEYIPKIVADGIHKVNFSCIDCMVQESQMLAMDVVLKDLPLFLREIAVNPNYSVYIAGKAFGAGVAALTSNEVSLADNVVSLITFGGSKFADIALAEYMDQHYGKAVNEDLASHSNNTYLRITTDGDSTPLFPILSSDYAHAGTNVNLIKQGEDIVGGVLRGNWKPALDALTIQSLTNDVKDTLKTAFTLPQSLVPSIAEFTGNLLCPVKNYS